MPNRLDLRGSPVCGPSIGSFLIGTFKSSWRFGITQAINTTPVLVLVRGRHVRVIVIEPRSFLFECGSTRDVNRGQLLPMS